jgi:ElaB/YqjD/DUF883 family membrane-anchored ribosome-binding protein
MTILTRFICIPVLAIAAVACQGRDAKVDDALNNDLSLASQANANARLDSISAAERAAATTSARRTTVHRSTSSASSSSTRSSQPADHVEKHPGRDAAIGAGAGAILGAATSKNKVKGGIIGAAAGGILGAVIGNNVDKKKVPNN